ncbi:MAG: XRE family transcriptional regulator [Spirochaetaceae bacterium]|nr:MAG: XRE family transcriptional regulator [Spirochaetaceae bacterium]
MKPVPPPKIGANIQKIRKEQGLTLDGLAERSGVSKAMLSQIESDKVNPTVLTIWKIARGLEIELDAILKGGWEPVRKFSVTRSSDAAVLDTSDGGPHIRVFSPISMAEDLEIYQVNFDPGTALVSGPHAPRAEEFLTVLDGAVRVEAGERSADLQTGDFINYHCDIDHVIENPHDAPASIQMIVRFHRKPF